ncbi:MAG: DMT family transporter, partial [Planctomycetota bacterium]
MSLRDRLALLLLGGIWGSSFLFMKVAEPQFGAVPLIALRVSIGAVLLTGLLAARGQLGALRGRAGAFLRIGALNSAVPFTLYAWSTGSLGAGLPSVLNATVPLFGALVAFVWLRERLSVARAVGLAVGFAGVLVLTWPKLAGAGAETSALGVAAGLLAALLYAVAAHDSKRTFAGVPPLAVAAGSMLGASALLVPPALFLLPAELPGPRALGAALALGVVCTSLAYALYFRLLEAL